MTSISPPETKPPEFLRNASGQAVKLPYYWTIPLVAATTLPTLSSSGESVLAGGEETLFASCAIANELKLEPIGGWSKLQVRLHDPLESIAPPQKLVPIENPSSRMSAVLGEHAMERIREFQTYPLRWDQGKRRSLSPASMAALETFVNVFSNFTSEPSVFLTPAGNAELEWEDEAGGLIQLEFFPDRIEYYIESINDEEGSAFLVISDIKRLAAKLQIHSQS